MDTLNEFQKGMTVLIVVLSILSFFASIFVLIQIHFHKINVTFGKELMIYITVSEIINSSSKIILIYKLVEGKNHIEECCDAQVIMALFSDYGTLLISTILSIQIHDSFQEDKWFKDIRHKQIIRSVIVAIPSLITILFSLLYFFEEDGKQNRELNRKAAIWCWVKPRDSMIIYSSYIALLSTMIVYSIKAMRFLKKQDSECAFIINKGEDDGSEAEKREAVQYSLRKISFYPIISFVIWSFLFLHRIIEAIWPRGNEDSWHWQDAFLIFHAIICSSRGIIYGAFYLGYGIYCCLTIRMKEIKKNNSLTVIPDSSNNT